MKARGGEVVSTMVSVESHSGTRTFSLTDEMKFIGMEKVISKLYMYFILNKEPLIKIGELMTLAHNIHQKHFKAHVGRRDVHEALSRSNG